MSDMNDDELRAALSRRASAPLTEDQRNDVMRASRVRALEAKPARRAVWPRLAGLVAATAAVLVLVLVALPIVLSPPVAGPSNTAGAQATSAPATAAAALPTASISPLPSPTSVPSFSFALPVSSSQQLWQLVGDPDWVGKAVLAEIGAGEIRPIECPEPAASAGSCNFEMLTVGGKSYRVNIGVRDATADDGVQQNDGNGYRWVKTLQSPFVGLYAFTIGQDDLEYLGPVILGPEDGPAEVASVHGNPSDPTDSVFAVSGWLTTTPPAPCAFPEEGLQSPMPDISSYYCGGSWLTADATTSDGSSGLTIDGGLHVQGGAYEEFAQAPQSSGLTSEPRLGIYLIRNAGCPEVVTGDCPVWRLVGRLDQDVSTRPSIAPTPWPATFLRVSNGTTLALSVFINGQALGTAPSDVVSGFDPTGYVSPWHVTITTESGRELVDMTYQASDISNSGSGSSGVAQRVDLSCGRLDVYAGPPLLGPAPPSSFPPNDCDP